MPRDPKMLTAEEVAVEFGVCAKTVTRWAKTGVFPATIRTPGGHRRWSRDDVDAKLADSPAVEAEGTYGRR
jgi:excisionase family DNA binding protein